MSSDAQHGIHPPGRNLAARISLVTSIIFLIPTIVILASNGFCLSSWGSQFLKTHPGHPLIFLFELVFEATILCLPFNALAGVIVLLVGGWGFLSAIRSPEGVGKRASVIGIGLASLIMALCVAGFFQWGSAWKQ
jgi:hypothetical protein